MYVSIVHFAVALLIRAIAHRENNHVRRCGRFFVLQYTPSHSSHADETEVQGEVSSTTIPFDYLVYAVGAETQTFGIPGVKEHACFMKEIQDAERVSPNLFEFNGKGEILIMLPSSSAALWTVRCHETHCSQRSHLYLRRRVCWLPWSERRGDRTFAPYGKVDQQ